jgi:cytochrome c-type biogenesis protein CcmH
MRGRPARVLVAERCVALVCATALTAAIALGSVAAVSSAAAPRASLLDIESEVMCVSCREPLELVSSPQALAEKRYIEGLIKEGETKQQILHELVLQYGVAVLGKPPASGFNLLIYVLPPAILAGGIAFLLLTLPRWRARGRAERPRPESAPLSPEDSKRIDEDLARLI